MDYIESNLVSGEEIVARTRLHWIILFWPAVLLLIGAGAGFFSEDLNDNWGQALFIVAVPWGVVAFMNLQTSKFAVTNKRVLMKVGWIRRHSLELLLTKVESILVDQGVLGRTLDYGTIILSGTGTAKQQFPRIAAALDFRKCVLEQIEAKESS
jgi:uncharacterized membrane protein YdbT with pleckstrin-like domain